MNGTRSRWGQTSAAGAVPLVRYLLAVHVGALEVDPGQASRALDHGPTGEGLATEAGHAVPTVLLCCVNFVVCVCIIGVRVGSASWR